MLKIPLLNTLVQVLGKMVTILISLVVTGVLTRKLGSEVYGQYILVTSAFILLDALADFGTKIMAVKMASEDEKRRETIWIQAGWLRIILSGVAFVLGLLFVSLFAGLESIRIEALVALVMIWFTSVAGSLEMVWQTKMEMGRKVLVEVLYPSIFLGMLWWTKMEINLLWVFGSYLVARIISLGVGLIQERKLIRKIVKADKKIIWEILKNSWPMGVYLLIFTGYDRAVDSLMLERMLGTREVAWYGLSYKIYSSLLQPVYFFVSSIFPLLSSKMKEKTRLFKWSAIIIGVGAILAMIFTYTQAPWMIRVLGGEEFGVSVGILRILIVAMVFAYYNHLIGFTLISKGKQKEMLKLGLVVMLFNISANLVFIPIYGVYGAAGVTGLTEALSLGLMGRRLWKDNKISSARG
jgi:O-antigen/teichoic acid export membrane protein